jgi:serine/threonine kinase 32
LRYAFQDEENMFMVIDLMLGGDLRFHLDRMGTVKEDLVKIWIAEVAYGLQFLHSKNIVHRDLKPDNILLCDLGHAHLTDFNIATKFRPDKPLTAVAGSMAYMAPEILARSGGYFSTIDWWSLGVIMYEFMFGSRPFRAKTNDLLTAAILEEDVFIPEQAEEQLSKESIDCVNAFLTRDITKRLGVKEVGGYDSIKKHPFFADIDWKMLEAKELPPPFVPDTKRANFDASHELEELLLEDHPLKAKKVGDEPKPKKVWDDPVIQAAMDIMDAKFEVYDHTLPRKAVVGDGFFMEDLMEGRDDAVCVVGIETSGNGAAIAPIEEDDASDQSLEKIGK